MGERLELVANIAQDDVDGHVAPFERRHFIAIQAPPNEAEERLFSSEASCRKGLPWRT